MGKLDRPRNQCDRFPRYGTANRLDATLNREAGSTIGDPLPPAWHWLYFPDLLATDALGQDGHPELGAALPPLGLPRRMWAGGRLQFEAPVHLGDTATRTSTIASIVRKYGTTGTLCFLTLEHDLAVDGVSCVKESQVLVYREASAAGGREPEPAPVASDAQARFEPNAPMLFRYSALTFNSHRIHYDVAYARDVEAYPERVVHGPLIATLLMDLADRDGRDLASFSYSAVSPLFLPHAFTTHAREGEDRSAELWAASHDGRVAMKATATYRQE